MQRIISPPVTVLKFSKSPLVTLMKRLCPPSTATPLLNATQSSPEFNVYSIIADDSNEKSTTTGAIQQPFACFFCQNVVEWVKKTCLFRIDYFMHNCSNYLIYKSLHYIQLHTHVNPKNDINIRINNKL